MDAFRLQGTVAVDTTAAERGLQSLSKQVADFGSSVKEGLGVGAGIAAFQTGLSVLEAGFGALKGSVVDFNQTIDGARAQMGRFFVDQQSLNNSIANLNDLAAKTPFAFEGLLTAQQRTIGAARSADELKQNMDAIAVASANTGRVSTANMDRISLALGQMQSKGHLAGGEMLQLTEAGVNMGEILAKHFGVTTAEIQKMVTEGKIGSQDVFAALRENAADPRNRQALDELAHTWEGALSTISDVGRTVMASTFRPLFDLMTEGAVAVADFLQSADFKSWAEAARLGFTAISDGVKGLIAFFAPLGDAIAAAFHQMTTGDFAGAFSTLSSGFQKQVDLIGEQVSAFIDGMFTGGSNAIISFADGMISGGMAAIKAAIDGITTFIADMLIGNSPPKSGPLSQLDKGGENAAKAWTDPFGQTMQKEVATTVEGAKKTIEGLRDASRDVAGQIRDINEQSQALDRTMKGLHDQIGTLKDAFAENTRSVKEAADATKQHYADAIQSVRDQIDTIKDQHEKAIEGIQRQVDTIKDRYGAAIDAVKAKIDGIKESYDAQESSIQRQIDQVKDKYGAAIDAIKVKIDGIKESYDAQETAVQRQIDKIKGQYSDALDAVKGTIDSIKASEEDQLSPLQKQLDLLQNANKLVRDRQDAEKSIANAKIQQLQLDALGDPKVRAQLQGQLAGLDVQQQQVDLAQQLAEAQDKLAKGGLSPIEQQSLSLKIQQLKIQQQLAGMVDATKLAEATQQEALLSAQQKQLDITRQIEDANNRLLAIPIEDKIAKIKAEAEAAMQPLQERLKDLETRQKSALDPLNDKLKKLKDEEQDALVPLQSRLKQIEHDQASALDPLNDKLRQLKNAEQDALTPLQNQLKQLERDQKAALDPLQDSIKNIKREEQDALRPLEQRVKDLTQEGKNADRVFDAMLSAIAAQSRAVIKPLEDQLAVYQHQKDALTEQKQELERIKAQITENIAIQQEAERAAKEAAKNKPAAPGAPAGGIGFEPDAEAKAAAEKWKAAGATLASNMGAGFAKWWEDNKGTVIERVIGAIAGGLIGGPIGAVAGAAFLPQFIDSLNKKLKERGFDAQPFIDAFHQGTETGNYDEVAKSIARGITRSILNAPGAIGRGVGDALVAAFTPDPSSGSNIGKAFVTGIGQGVSDAINGFIGAWAKNNDRFIEETKRFFLGIVNNIRAQFGLGPEGGTGQSSPVGEGVGDSMVQGVEDGIVKHTGIFNTISQVMQKIIDTVKGIFGIRSPSTVMAEIGTDIIQGLLDGVTDRWTSLQKWWTDLPKNIQTAFGWTGNAFTWVNDLNAIGSKMLENIWDGLNTYWTQFSQWWTDLPKNIQTAFGWTGSALTWVQDLQAIGIAVLTGMRDGIQSFWNDTMQPWLQGAGSWITGAVESYGGGTLKWLVKSGSDALQGMQDGIQGFWDQTLSTWLQGAGDWITKAFTAYAGGPINWLMDAGSKVLEGLKNGFFTWLQGDEESVLAKWIRQNLTDRLPEWVKHALGVNSPSTVFKSIGQSLIDGLLQGMQDRFPAISSFIGQLNATLGGTGSVPGQLSDWINAAMQAEGVDPGKWAQGLGWLAMHESGGQADPPHNNAARGVMQTMPGTFASFRDRNLPDDILNPIANIAAAIRYIQQEYETGRKTGYPIDINGIVSQWGRPGTFFEHGYKDGGIAWGPQTAHLAEVEPEVIIPRSWFARQGGSSFQNDQSASPVQTHEVIMRDPSGRVLANWWIKGRDIAIETRRAPLGTV